MKKKQIILCILCISFLLSGLALLLYSPWKTAALTTTYRQEITRLKTYLDSESAVTDTNLPDSSRPFPQLWEDCEAYNRLLFATTQEALSAQTITEAPLSPANDGWQAEAFGYLSIPAIALEAPVYLGASEKNLERGGAVLGQTSLPLGGENTNCVIAGHRSFQGAVLFRPIERLLPGDLVFFVNPWETLVYKVVETKIISPGDIQDILIQPGKDLLTLLTCAYPNDQRVLVLCERTEDAACEKETVFARRTVLRKTRPWDWFRTIRESPCGYFTK